MKNSYILGLDVGIASVGYGLIHSDSKSVIDAGVRLFPEANVENNEGRRAKRGSRRLKRRRIHRLDRVKNLLAQYHLIIDDKIPKSTNPYAIRVKGLSSPLSKSELVIALLHLAKRRGIHNVNVVMDENESTNELSTKEQLKENAKQLENRYVCELQLDRLNEQYKVRGERNRFKTEDFVREARQILTTQQKYHDIDEHFIEQYTHLLETRREYYEGPGKGSQYGWDGDLKQWYEMLMGRCTYFPEELRSVKYAYTADLFNALNDLNNLVIARDENEKLEYFEKYHIIENVFKQKKTPTLKQIAKEIDVKESDIKGYRITKNGKPQFTSFKLYHDLNKIFLDKKNLENIELLDEIAFILTLYQDPLSIKEALDQLQDLLTESEKEAIAHLNGYTGTHRLSLKCLHLLIDEMWQTSRNQMEVFTALNLKPQKYQLSKQKQIPKNMVEAFILSPVVKRSFIQSIEIVNSIIKKYGLPEEIIIELAREKNSEDRRKFLNRIQKENENTRKQVEEVIREYGNRNAKGLVEKIKLHQMQEGKCLYSLQNIPLDDLLRNPSHYEIDHIIPRSVSFDNSFNNKVLVKQEENSKKGNRTPYQYLNSNESVLSYVQFKQHILNLSKSKERISKKKREYLLEERDINKFEVQKEFINRNLVDTRYATRELVQLLKSYFSANDLDVKVKTINGSFTNYLRKAWKFDKSRNKGFKHHAEDALIIANVSYLFKQSKELKEANAILENNNLSLNKNKDSKNLLTEQDYRKMFEIPKQVQDIKDYKDFKYSHRVDKKPNRQLINDSLYSTREVNENHYIVQTVKDIYAKDNTKIKDLFLKTPEKLLMYKHDPQTFEKLMLVIKQYGEEKNPFAKYYEENGEYLTKYAKNDKGPTIKRLKYIGKKVGTHLDISRNFSDAKRKVVQLSIKPFRFDVFHSKAGYHMLTLTYMDIKKKEKHYQILKNEYQALKERYKVPSDAQFIGSFYYNDLISINDELFRVIGVNNSTRNIVELNMVDINYKDYCDLMGIKKTPRFFKTIAKKTEKIEKYSTDILGNQFKVKPSKSPQLIFKRGVL